MTRLLITIVVLVGLLTACGATSPSAPAPTDAPGRVIPLPDLLAAAAANDGHAVRLSGMFLADGQTARLCEVSLDSYPPQCGGAAVRLVGEVPQAVLALLTHTTEPDLAQATWGHVVVTGTFHATGAGGGPTVELGEVILAEG